MDLAVPMQAGWLADPLVPPSCRPMLHCITALPNAESRYNIVSLQLKDTNEALLIIQTTQKTTNYWRKVRLLSVDSKVILLESDH